MTQVAAARAVEVPASGAAVGAAAVATCGDAGCSGAPRDALGDPQKILRISDHYEIGKKLGSG